MSDYRDTNYTLYTMGTTKPNDYIQQCKLENEQVVIWRWINVKYIYAVGAKDCYLEFKDTEGNWDGKSWRVIQIMPRLRLKQVIEMQKNDPTIVIVDDDDGREWQRWNK